MTAPFLKTIINSVCLQYMESRFLLLCGAIPTVEVHPLLWTRVSKAAVHACLFSLPSSLSLCYLTNIADEGLEIMLS